MAQNNANLCIRMNKQIKIKEESIESAQTAGTDYSSKKVSTRKLHSKCAHN